MSIELEKRPQEISAMSEGEYYKWLDKILDDMEEAEDRKGIRQYIVDDALDGANSIGNKISEVVDEYQQWREAEREADRAEEQARQMEERVRRRRQELGR